MTEAEFWIHSPTKGGTLGVVQKKSHTSFLFAWSVYARIVSIRPPNPSVGYVQKMHEGKLLSLKTPLRRHAGCGVLFGLCAGMQRRGTQKSKMGTHKLVQLSATEVM